MKKLIGVLLAIVLVVGMAGCSASENVSFDKEISNSIDSVGGGNGIFGDVSSDKVEGSTNYPQENKPTVDAESGDIESDYVDRKIVYTVITELQTKDFDAAIDVINDSVEKNGGYVQSQKQTNDSDIYSNYSRRTLNMVVRVPSEKLDDFLAGLQNDSMYTLSLSKDSKDYSATYYDKEMRVNSLKIQEERLLDLLSKANDLTTILDLEDRLSNVRYQIESLTKEMNYIDSNVAYSTITIRMNEVVEYKVVVEEPATFFERTKEAIVNSWDDFVEGSQDFVIWLIYAMPTLMIFGIIAIVVIFTIKVTKKRKQNLIKKNQELGHEDFDSSDNNP